MIELSRSLIVLSIILVFINIICTVLRLFIQRDALLKNEGAKLFQSIFALVLMLLLAVLFCVIYSRQIYFGWVGSLIFIFSLCLTVFLGWFFNLIDGIEERSMDLVSILVGVVEAGDVNLEGHSLLVQKLTMLLYEYLPLNYRIVINPDNLSYASLFIDIGKLGIPRSIINKKGKFSNEEWEVMRKHPEYAVEILSSIKSFSTVSKWIRYHHERIDGLGYYHLKEKEIPLASRIIAVADTYAALTMERPYKPSLSHDEALFELRLIAGSQLDSEIVKIFSSIPKRKIDSCISEVKEKIKICSMKTLR